MTASDAEDLQRRVAGIPWYHSIELPGGIVTPGEYDHRSSVSRMPIPASLANLRCLDVGTHDGFWAFEMERRGPSEVVAIDIDDPGQIDFPGPPTDFRPDTMEWLKTRRMAFNIAHEALQSNVALRNHSVYDLDPDIVGTFNFAFLGTLLHHLRDPIGALMALRRIVTGTLVVGAIFSVSKTVMHPRQPVSELMGWNDIPFWEVPNLAALRRQFLAAGWSVDTVTKPFFQQYGSGWKHKPISMKPGDLHLLPRQLLLRRGALHVGVRAHPASLSPPRPR